MITALTQDTATLPAALLPLAKRHCRIDPITADAGADAVQDADLQSIIYRVIGRLQDKTDIAINPQTWRWRPNGAAWDNGAMTVPVRPVSAFTATVPGDPDPVDVAADYALALKWETISGPPIQVMQGAAADGLTFELTAGMPPTGPDVLPAPVLDVLLRYVSHLWEHRDILVPGREFVSPDLASELVWWTPRV